LKERISLTKKKILLAMIALLENLQRIPGKLNARHAISLKKQINCAMAVTVVQKVSIGTNLNSHVKSVRSEDRSTFQAENAKVVHRESMLMKAGLQSAQSVSLVNMLTRQKKRFVTFVRLEQKLV